MIKVLAVVASVVLLAGTLLGQQQTGWINASNDTGVQYRVQILEQTKACSLEFRDQKQGAGYTTFDVEVDYRSIESNSDREAKMKTDTEHIVTAPNQNGNSRIPDCSQVGEARVRAVQRH
jgi:hypothetical protein